MEFEELNMLAELQMELSLHSQALDTIHNGLCGREVGNSLIS